MFYIQEAAAGLTGCGGSGSPRPRRAQDSVKASHYTPVGEALIFALDHCLGPDFTNEVKSAWLAAYGALSGVMIAATYGEQDAA